MNFGREFDLIRNFVFKPCSKDFHARDCNMVSGYFPLRKVPTEGGPPLRFLQGVGDDAAGATLVRSIPPVAYAVVPLRKVRDGRSTRICGGFCSWNARPPRSSSRPVRAKACLEDQY